MLECHPAANTGTTPAVASPAPKLGRARLRIAFYGVLAGLLAASAVETRRVMLGDNFHTVLPGLVYRCAQVPAHQLEAIILAHGIRTVVNLRGCCAPLPWYVDECRMTHHLDVDQEDICFSAGRLPAGHELHRLVEVLDRSEPPLLMHCRRGADRTGLASAIVLLLKTNTPLEQACRQLGLRYGHVALGRPAYLDQFFDLYRGWLARRQLAHSPSVFRHWLEHGYCDGECRCLVEPIHFPPRIPRGQPCALRVRVHNQGRKAWHLQPESNAGFHLRFALWDEQDHQVAAGRAALFHDEVLPGQSIELTFALPPLRKPGRHRLLVDMVDEQHCWFYQTGSEPLDREIYVCE
jgi:hypothetical protein